MKIKDKGILLTFVLVILIVNFLFTVSAVQTVGIVNPTFNYTNMTSSTRYLNASVLTVDGASSAGNVSFYYQPWFYNYNSTWILIGNSSNNVSVSQTTFNRTWDTTTVADGIYNLNVSVVNYGYVTTTYNGSNVTRNITIDNTMPTTIAYTGAALTAYTNGTTRSSTTFSNNLTLNISVSDATVGLLNSTNSFCYVNVNGELNHSIPEVDGWCNSSDINVSGLSDGNKTINIYINDTVNNMRLNNTLVVQVDTTAPTASAVCSPTTVNTGDIVTCTCSPSDSTSGINASATSITANPSTPNTGTFFTESCSFADYAGNTGSALSNTYTVEQAASGSSTQVPVKKSATTSNGTTTKTLPETASTMAKHVFDSIMPGVAAVQKDFNKDAGVKEISIEVSNPAQNVEVTVTKHDGKPAEVSVEKTGKLYTYLQIEATNLTDKLSKATITFQVEKTWATDNGLTKDKVSAFKFDESSNVWNELSTTFLEEDDTFYYYTSDVNSFSYFAIGEKTVVESSGKGGKTWVWVILVLAVLGAIAWFVMNRKK